MVRCFQVSGKLIWPCGYCQTALQNSPATPAKELFHGIHFKNEGAQLVNDLDTFLLLFTQSVTSVALHIHCPIFFEKETFYTSDSDCALKCSAVWFQAISTDKNWSGKCRVILKAAEFY